ncbi:MAG: type II toxin-antitoxin system RelE/ParE family toxin [Pseudomonadota bacterium]
MIKGIRHKGLKRFAATGDARKLSVQKSDRIRRQLVQLDAATKPEDLNLPGYRFHGLAGKPKRYAIDVSENWRMTFGWDGENVIDIDLEDYH